MTEELIRALAEIAQVSPTLRFGPAGGISMYPEDSSIGKDTAGNKITVLSIRVRAKGEEPTVIFRDAEEIYRAFTDGECPAKLRKKRIPVYAVEAYPPTIENCDGCGLFVASFKAEITLPYPLSFADAAHGGENTGGGETGEDAYELMIEYDGGNGNFIGASDSRIRLTGAKGTEPFSGIFAEENAFFDGADYISSRIPARRITLSAEIKDADAYTRRRLYRVFRTGNEGTLYFTAGKSVRKIACRTEKITAASNGLTQTFGITLLCVSPFFENSADARFQLCGTCDMWEFDDFELSEKNEFEFSAIINRSSALIVNDGDVPSGCVITVEIERPNASGIKITAKGTGESLAVKGVYAYGDIITFDTRDGQKSVTLSRRGDPAAAADITNRIVWGSRFFRIPAGSERISISADGGLDGISADIVFSERFEGI